MIRRLIKLVVITVATLVFGSALYLQFPMSIGVLNARQAIITTAAMQA